MILILLYVTSGLGYVLKCYVKKKMKYSFENVFVEKGKSSTWNEWLIRGLFYTNNLNVHLHRFVYNLGLK